MDQCKEFAVNEQYIGTLEPCHRHNGTRKITKMVISLYERQRSKWYYWSGRNVICFTIQNCVQDLKLIDEPVLKRKGDTFLLCLNADLAHGVDLSFVTHIFLLEAINDAALLEQVTARAHRLGATGPVSIDTIRVFYKCSDAFQDRQYTITWTEIRV